MQIHPWWHSGIHPCPTSSLLHNFFLLAQWDLLPLWFPDRVGPRPVKFVPGDTYPRSSLLHNFFSSDTVGLTSSLVFPYWYSGTCFLFSSSLVVQLDPALPNFFPTCKFVPADTVGPTPSLVCPYFTISSLMVQWDLPP